MTQPTFEEALAELDKIVEQMDAKELPLDQIVEKYKRGALLIKQCRSQLDGAEAAIKKLDGDTLKPLDDDGKHSSD